MWLGVLWNATPHPSVFPKVPLIPTAGSRRGQALGRCWQRKWQALTACRGCSKFSHSAATGIACLAFPTGLPGCTPQGTARNQRTAWSEGCAVGASGSLKTQHLHTPPGPGCRPGPRLVVPHRIRVSPSPLLTWRPASLSGAWHDQILSLPSPRCSAILPGHWLRGCISCTTTTSLFPLGASDRTQQARHQHALHQAHPGYIYAKIDPT